MASLRELRERRFLSQEDLARRAGVSRSTVSEIEGNRLRGDVQKGARFIGMSLERDLQSTGVGLASTTSFGSLALWGDTIAILGAAYTPPESPPYDLNPPPGASNPLARG